MKKIYFLFAAIGLLVTYCTQAQVEIDHPIQLTGAGVNAKISGIQSVSATQDAVNVGSIQNGGFIYAPVSGINDSFMLNITPSISSYQTGMVFNFISNQNITGAATLNINNLGTVPIVQSVNQSLTSCEIANGQAVTVLYDGANFQMLSYPNQNLAPSAPVATAATGVSSHQITANWNTVSSASSYALDVSADPTFTTGFVVNNLNVGNVLTYTVTGLTTSTNYYYRVRAINGCGTSANSNSATATTLNIALDIVSYWKLDESSGNAADAVGPNTATNANVTYGPGLINNCAQFANDNTNAVLSPSTSGFPTGASPRTISLWWNGPELPASLNVYQLFFWYGYEWQDELCALGIFNTGSGYDLTFTGGNDDLNYPITPGLNTWYHIVGTFDGTTATIYFNGASIASANKSAWNTTIVSGATIGAQPGGNWTYGMIDEVGIWNRALSAAEVAALYNNGNGVQYPF